MNPIDNKFVRVCLIVLAFLLATMSVQRLIDLYQEASAGGPDKDTLTISAIGKVEATPDLARADLAVVTEGADTKQIQDENSKKINEIIAFLKQQGLSDAYIKTQNYTLYPSYNYNDGRQVLDGYTISQNLSLKIRALDSIGDIIAGAVERGVNTVNSLTFEIEKPENLQQDARKQALENAKVKAEELAQVAGVKLGKVKSFSESAISAPPGYPIPYERGLAEGLGGASPDIQPGSTTVTATVSVTFELE